MTQDDYEHAYGSDGCCLCRDMDTLLLDDESLVTLLAVVFQS